MRFAGRFPTTYRIRPHWKTFHILTTRNDFETKMGQDSTEESLSVEENIQRGRSDSLYMAHELTRMRTQYEEATEDHQRAQSRAESRRSHGPPKGFSRTISAIHDVWTHHISIIVPQDLVRDHLGMFPLLTFCFCLKRISPVRDSSINRPLT